MANVLTRITRTIIPMLVLWQPVFAVPPGVQPPAPSAGVAGGYAPLGTDLRVPLANGPRTATTQRAPTAADDITRGYYAAGSVPNIVVGAAGTGYVQASPPTITIGAPATGGRQATAVAVVSAGGVVTGYTITDPGQGYTSAPTVTVAAPSSGTTATGTANYHPGSAWLYNGRLWVAQSTVAGHGVWQQQTIGGALPLDLVSGTAVAYGTVKLRAAYAGSALQLTRASDSATLNVGFLSDGTIDAASADAFVAGTTGYVTTWYDQGTGGYNATQSTVANAPLWVPGDLVGTVRAVTFASQAHAIAGVSINARYLTIPSGWAWTPSSTSVFLAGQTNVSYESRALLMNSAANAGVWLSYANGVATMLTNGFGGPCGVAPVVNPGVFMESWQSFVLGCAANNHVGRAGAGGATAQTGASLGGGATSQLATMSAVAVIAYTSGLTSAQQASVRLSLHALTKIQPQADTVVLQLGDSTSVGTYSATASSILRKALALLGSPAEAYNDAVFGTTLAVIAPSVTTRMAAYYSPSQTNFIAYVLAGANDIRGGATAATVFGLLQTTVAGLKALGGNVRVLVGTEPLQCDVLGNSSWLAQEQVYNGLIQTKWSLPQAQGGLGADGLVDFWSDPTVGAAQYSSSAFCSSVYAAPDGEHPNDLTEAYFAPLLAAGIEAVRK